LSRATSIIAAVYCIPTLWNVLWCLSDAPDYLVEVGKVYLDLGYLTQSLQAHTRNRDLVKDLNSDKPSFQVCW